MQELIGLPALFWGRHTLRTFAAFPQCRCSPARLRSINKGPWSLPYLSPKMPLVSFSSSYGTRLSHLRPCSLHTSSRSMRAEPVSGIIGCEERLRTQSQYRLARKPQKEKYLNRPKRRRGPPPKKQPAAVRSSSTASGQLLHRCASMRALFLAFMPKLVITS